MIVYIEKDMTSLNWIMPFIAKTLLVEFTERDFDIFQFYISTLLITPFGSNDIVSCILFHITCGVPFRSVPL